MIISKKFPRYEKFEPKVPVYCVTPGEGRILHRFFDTSPFSPSGRYMALFRLPDETDIPKPGDKGEIVIVDLQEGIEKVVAESHGFEDQLGANINWGENDDLVIYNDVDPQTWEYYGIKLNWKTGEKTRLEIGVYHVSPDGLEACTGNPSCKWRTQPGYGVLIPEELTKTVSIISEDEGLFITDTRTGKAKLLLSMKEIFETCYSKEYIEEKKDGECYLFHSKYSPSGKKIMFSTRWIPKELHNCKSAIGKPEIRFIIFTCNRDGSNLQASIPEEHWINRGHHTTWHPSEELLTMNLVKDWGKMLFATATLDGKNIEPMFWDVTGSGHPTVHPNGKFLITDVYAHEELAYGDGTAPLRLVYLESGDEEELLRINVRTPYQSKNMALRVDPHPAWDRTNRYVAFNAYEGGTRRVYVMDMEKYINR
ncbi:hypothetical protein SH1V18_39240 [Vallitalea longa]|uniref:Oligogalacturonate lyase domain-containing protein n=1 Tax=Vallitalea longa TaxID=2936439 RepID=A0A9W6DI21_9FIRM|nr:hypothetical protein [Vallitalea longa]GKX31444.1 hypothetical protein SH1V18_39240 [Vallitalea longa]